MALSQPLLTNDNSRSHCAAGSIYEVDVKSNSEDQQEGRAYMKSRTLNLPKPVAEMADSKSAGSEFILSFNSPVKNNTSLSYSKLGCKILH